MTLQNVRSMLFRGEDLGYGGGSTREWITPSQAVAAQRPLILAQGFYGSTTQLTQLLGVSANPSAAVVGLNRFIVNRSSQYWMNLTGPVAYGNSAAGILTVTLPIPPLGMLFLPWTFYGGVTTVTLSADNPWPLVTNSGQPAGYPPPTAGSSTGLTYDYVQEQ